MRLTDLASPPELSLLLGVSGAAAVVVFGDASLPSLITGSALGLAAVAGAWSARRGRSRSVQAMASHVAQLQEFSDALAPVWSAQIESSRRQMEDAVTSLAERFAQISSRLDQTLALSTGTQGHGSAERVSARSQQELDAVVRLLRASLESKAELVTRVQGLVRFLDELQEMARAIGQITQQTNLLAINATIEAAHAGQFGRGFATVAQEVRLLSKQSGETGDRIAEKISMIGAEIAATCAAAEASATRERDAIGVSEGTINAVLAGFSEFADTLTGTTERLRHESEGIKGEVNEALVQLQFQDRISQVMNHVSTNIDRLPQTMRSYGEECVEAGRLQPLVAAELLAELERTYAMAEERTTHQQPRLAPAAASANDANITFF